MFLAMLVRESEKMLLNKVFDYNNVVALIFRSCNYL